MFCFFFSPNSFHVPTTETMTRFLLPVPRNLLLRSQPAIVPFPVILDGPPAYGFDLSYTCWTWILSLKPVQSEEWGQQYQLPSPCCIPGWFVIQINEVALVKKTWCVLGFLPDPTTCPASETCDDITQAPNSLLPLQLCHLQLMWLLSRTSSTPRIQLSSAGVPQSCHLQHPGILTAA